MSALRRPLTGRSLQALPRPALQIKSAPALYPAPCALHPLPGAAGATGSVGGMTQAP